VRRFARPVLAVGWKRAEHKKAAEEPGGAGSPAERKAPPTPAKLLKERLLRESERETSRGAGVGARAVGVGWGPLVGRRRGGEGRGGEGRGATVRGACVAPRRVQAGF
jgi:hypothetical protein